MQHKYLLRLKQNREDNKTVIYLDKTWMHSHDGLDHSWLEKDSFTGNNNCITTLILLCDTIVLAQVERESDHAGKPHISITQ